MITRYQIATPRTRTGTFTIFIQITILEYDEYLASLDTDSEMFTEPNPNDRVI
jgi:hypothetical protein